MTYRGIPTAWNSATGASTASDTVNAMSADELEALVMSVMKKELNTIVNLGALIGFILGLLNIFI